LPPCREVRDAIYWEVGVEAEGRTKRNDSNTTMGSL
jgi:hypothetical protein